MKLRLVRLNPLTLEPGEFFVMCGRNLHASNFAPGVEFTQFPARLEYTNNRDVNGLEILNPEWQPVEFTNEFQSDESYDAREVRPEVQIPVYSGPTGTKGSSGTKRR